MSTAPHHCVRPEPAGHTEPWRCPDCGMLWEPLPPEPIKQARPRRTVNKRVLVAVGVSIAGAGAAGGAALLLTPSIAVLVVFLAAIAVVTHWGNIRP